MAVAETARNVRVMQNYIGGEWVDASGSDELAVIDPAGGTALARVPLSSVADVEAAVAAARGAVEEWRARPVLQRSRMLFQFRELVADRLEEFARLLTRDTGKALTDARLEMQRALETIECATAMPSAIQGRTLSQIANGVDVETYRQPVGVCAAITPFNFPGMLTMWFLPFAIGCGNAFILKPSEQTPLVPELVFQLLEQVGLPPGVANLVHGGADVVNALLDSREIDAVSFIGSARTARHVYQRAAATGKRVQAFGGAKNYMVVMPDAVIPRVVENIVTSAFGGAGQRCMAGAVVVAVDGVWERLREPLLESAKRMRVGNGTDPEIDLGPVVSQQARAHICEMIDGGLADGARLALDGRQPDADPNGAFLGPTVLEKVDLTMAVAREEIFGPVLTVLEVDSLDDALAVVNASAYGNGTSIFTESGAAVRRYREVVQVGMVGVNLGVAAPISFMPFGGWKDSFLGDIGACADEAVRFYTRNKIITSRWFSADEGDKYFVEN